MKKRLALVTILLTLASSHTVFADSGVINASSLNIRQKPSLSSSILSSIPNNTKISTLGKSGAFYKINYKGKTGYVYSSYVKIVQATAVASATPSSTTKTGVGSTKAWGLNVRKTAAIGNNTIGSLNATNNISLYGSLNGYYKIKYNNNWGYIAKSYVSTATPSLIATIPLVSSTASQISTLMSSANKLLGIHYTYGGTTPSTGFDCSGFVQYIYKTIGVTLSRTTYTQVEEGSAVSINDLKVGDLLFFIDNSHEGVYIGNNKFIQAQKTGTVVHITDLSGYWRTSFVTGRRILN
ncbi:C40 family peptidase [Clostridium frigoris]|uniref:C40 family peptidase n=1 Tax=Clostridium frigoris TaxID=205327 RepID=A0ABS6BVA1_9CLOT|nr:C40 family peptidase [Clostridium frigoris]MBU3160851.1 C40 family peptidase [Clostridium frigoris]